MGKSLDLSGVHIECKFPRTNATAVMSSESNVSSNFVPTRHASAPINTPNRFLELYPRTCRIESRKRAMDCDDAHPLSVLHGSNTTSAKSVPTRVKKSATDSLPRNLTNGHIASVLAFLPIVSLRSVSAVRVNPLALHSPPYRTRVVPNSNAALGALHAPIDCHPNLARVNGRHGRSHTTRTDAPKPTPLRSSNSSDTARAIARALPLHAGATMRSVTPPTSVTFISSDADADVDASIAEASMPYHTARDSGARAAEYSTVPSN
mmetsp:Transcript_4541/g.15046  ORF Transcript_4541/g.15046 Transcript_4541/m.15046 type:complete len:264 (-) Transcript_4541:184-975(-)